MKNPNLDKFPLGFWPTLEANKAPANHPEEWAEIGMTLAMGDIYNHGVTDPDHFKAILDCAHANSIRIILSDNRAEARNIRTLGEDGYRASLQAVIDQWGSHPAVWGVHLGDEPNKEDYPLFVTAIRMFRELAPHLEPYANLLLWFPGVEKNVGADSWPDYLDKFIADTGMKYISYDCYTQMRSDPEALPIYFRNLKLYGNAARRNNVPFWTIVLSVPHFKYRDPSLDDLRWQLNTAVACGAKGVSWFYLYQQDLWLSNYRNAPVNQMGRKTEKFYQIGDVQNIFMQSIGPVLDKLTLQKVYHVCQSWGGFELFTGDEEIALTGDATPMIMSYFEDEADPTWKYVLVVNNSTTESVLYNTIIRGQAVTAELLVKDGVWRPMAGNLHDNGTVEYSADGLVLPHWYAPGQAVLYRYHR